MLLTDRILTRWLAARNGSAPPEGPFSPEGFYPLASRLLRWLAPGAAACCALGLYLGFASAPADGQQGGLVRIIFIHVPAAWMATLLFLVMASWAGVGAAFRSRLASMMVQAIAPTGAMFAVMALLTGSLWGKPTWGSWWDLRLAAALTILVIDVAVVSIHATLDDTRLADSISAMVTLPGVLLVPGILAYVFLWPSGQQSPMAGATGRQGLPLETMASLAAVLAGFGLYATAMALKRLRCIILERERHSDWITHPSGRFP